MHTDCSHCGHPRKEELKMPCEFCGSSQTTFGYLYKHEFDELRRAFMRIIIVIVVIIFTVLVILVAMRFSLFRVSAMILIGGSV